MPFRALALEQLGPDALAALIETALDAAVLVGVQGRVVYANLAACEVAGRQREQLLGQPLRDLVAAELRDDLDAHLPMGQSSSTERRSTTLVRPDGERREVEYTVTGITAATQPLAFVAMRDVTESRRVVRWAAALAQIASSVAFAGTLESTLASLARTLVRVTGVAASTVTLIESADRRTWRAAASYGLPTGYADALEAAWRAGVPLPSARAYETRQPAVQADVRRLVLAEPRCAALHDFMAQVEWDILVAVPLVVRGRTVGTLVGYYLPDQPPGEDEIAFLSSIADQAAVAVENARLFVEAQGKAALEERQKLARELHDSISQTLYGIGLGARTARELLERDPPRAAGPVDYIASLAEAGLAEMRALISELRPDSLISGGLVTALSKQAASLRARHGIAISTMLGDEPDIPLRAKEELYRITQEALHNVVRHARATGVELLLSTHPDAVEIAVRDNGRGFAVDEEFPGHLGLRSMRERAASLGGELRIQSAPGAGTLVIARLPR
jgi:PAS domain S-box-containing protein